MGRGILYIPGAGQHSFNQSAGLVADRIARALRSKLASRTFFNFRIAVESDVHYFEGIPIDIASIEVAKNEKGSAADWKNVLDVIELKYLPRFTKSFSDLSPFERVVRGIQILVTAGRKRRGTRVPLQSSTSAEPVKRAAKLKGDTEKPDLKDRFQVLLFNWSIFRLSVFAIFYWVLVAFIAALGILTLLGIDFLDIPFTLFGIEVDTPAYLVPSIAFVAVVMTLWYFARESTIKDRIRHAADAFSVTAYYCDEREFLDTLNAILDSAEYLKATGYKPLDMLSLSLGAILTTDAIFPKPPYRTIRSSKTIASLPTPIVDTWITVGFPYSLVDSQQPKYFTERESPLLNIKQWFNIWIMDDPLASKVNEERGIGVCSGDTRCFAPHHQWEYEPDKSKVTKRFYPRDWKDFFVVRRIANHCLYWDDQNARAMTCFEEIVDKAGWTTDLENVLQGIR
jgi:hypothetical protein